MSIREEMQHEMWMNWSLIWPIFLSACSHSAESGGFVEGRQQQLSEALGQRGWWETATTAGGQLGLMNLLVTPNISVLISRAA